MCVCVWERAWACVWWGVHAWEQDKQNKEQRKKKKGGGGWGEIEREREERFTHGLSTIFAPSKASSDQDNNSRRTPMMRVLDFGRSFDYPTVATAKCRLQSCTSPPEQSNLKPWWSRSLTVTEEAKSEEIMIGMNVSCFQQRKMTFSMCVWCWCWWWWWWCVEMCSVESRVDHSWNLRPFTVRASSYRNKRQWKKKNAMYLT